MPMSPITTDDPNVYAFEFFGTVDEEDLTAMAEIVSDAFDRYGSISLLLVFRDWEGAEASGILDPKVLETQLRSLENVDRYAVVGAPAAAELMIDLMDYVIPVDAETFEPDEEHRAWAFVGARPSSGPAGSV